MRITKFVEFNIVQDKKARSAQADGKINKLLKSDVASKDTVKTKQKKPQ